MMHWNSSLRGFGFLALLMTASFIKPGWSTEIQLKQNCRISDSVVTLGDVAVLVGEEQTVRKMSQLELFPAPPSGRSKRVTRQTIEEWISLRGLDVNSHVFSGAPAVVIKRSSIGLASMRTTTTFLSSGSRFATPVRSHVGRQEKVLARQAASRVERALHVYLSQVAPSQKDWKVDVRLTEDQAYQVPARINEMQIRGGKPPWTGPQQFVLAVRRDNDVIQLPLSATIKLPPMVVITTRRIGRDEVIRPVDVKLARASLSTSKSTFTSVDEVVGKEATRTLIEGQAISQQSVRSPVLVKRRETVVVIAKTPGIIIRTYGHALEDGSMNDLIRVQPVELNKNKESFVARVVGSQRVELFASGSDFPSESRKVSPTTVTQRRRPLGASPRVATGQRTTRRRPLGRSPREPRTLDTRVLFR